MAKSHFLLFIPCGTVALPPGPVHVNEDGRRESRAGGKMCGVRAVLSHVPTSFIPCPCTPSLSCRSPLPFLYVAAAHAAYPL
jgi:hypothetical protein